MSPPDEKGSGLVRAPGDEQLRERLRAALDRFIDPDDDTMPRPDRVDGGYVWEPTEGVLDDLVHAITKEQP